MRRYLDGTGQDFHIKVTLIVHQDFQVYECLEVSCLTWNMQIIKQELGSVSQGWSDFDLQE